MTLQEGLLNEINEAANDPLLNMLQDTLLSDIPTEELVNMNRDEGLFPNCWDVELLGEDSVRVRHGHLPPCDDQPERAFDMTLTRRQFMAFCAMLAIELGRPQGRREEMSA